jgi:hypothetical protein
LNQQQPTTSSSSNPQAEPEQAQTAQETPEIQALLDGVERIAGRQIEDRHAAEQEAAEPERTEPVADPDPGQPGADLGTDAVEAETQAPAITTLKELAEQAGVDIEQLYDVEVRLAGDAEPVKLGEVKDRLQSVDKDRAQLIEDRQAYENARLKEQGELAALLDEIGPNITPETVARAKQAREALVASEHEKLMGVMPDWKDKDNWSRDKGSMVEFVSEYGFNEAEFDNVLDHRLIKLLHDSATNARTLKAANKQLREAKKAPRGSKPGPKTPGRDRQADVIAKGKAAGTTEQKTAAIAELLGL